MFRNRYYIKLRSVEQICLIQQNSTIELKVYRVYGNGIMSVYDMIWLLDLFIFLGGGGGGHIYNYKNLQYG